MVPVCLDVMKIGHVYPINSHGMIVRLPSLDMHHKHVGARSRDMRSRHVKPDSHIPQAVSTSLISSVWATCVILFHSTTARISWGCGIDSTMIKKKNKRLRLGSESVRVLADASMLAVRGAAAASTGVPCVSYFDTQCTCVTNGETCWSAKRC